MIKEFNALLAELAAYKAAVVVLRDGAEPEVGDEYIFPKYSKGASNRYIKGYYSAWFHKKKYHGCQLHGDRIGDLYCFASSPAKDAHPNIEISVRDEQSVTEVLGRPTKRQGKPVIYASALKGKGGVV